VNPRKDGKDWTDDDELRSWVKERDSSLLVITRKSINRGAMILKPTGEVIHEDESNSSLLERVKSREKKGKSVSESSIKKPPFGFSVLSCKSIGSRISQLEKEIEYHRSGKSAKLYKSSEIRRKIRDCETEIKELKGDL